MAEQLPFADAIKALRRDVGIRRARDGGMIYALLYFVVAGTTP